MNFIPTKLDVKPAPGLEKAIAADLDKKETEEEKKKLDALVKEAFKECGCGAN